MQAGVFFGKYFAKTGLPFTSLLIAGNYYVLFSPGLLPG